MCDICDIGGPLCDPGVLVDFACSLCDSGTGGGGIGGDGIDFQCFSGTTLVDVQGYGPTKMQDLKLGDHIRTTDGYQVSSNDVHD